MTAVLVAVGVPETKRVVPSKVSPAGRVPLVTVNVGAGEKLAGLSTVEFRLVPTVPVTV